MPSRSITFAAVWALSSLSASAATYSADVQPILQARCVACHQPGDIAPMALRTYAEVRPWAKSIKEAVASRVMPPWHAAPGAAHQFRNDRALSQREIETITSWVDSGSPEGKTGTAPQFASGVSTWKIGKPDFVVQVPGLQVAKEGVLPYTFLIVPTHFEKDTWVRAAEFRIDQRATVHHMNVFVREPGSSYLADFPRNQIFVPTVTERGKKRAGEAVFARRQLLQGYEPGYEPSPWLEDGAKLIKAGSDLVFEMHFNPNGTAAVDHSEIGLYFAPKVPAKRVLAIDTLRDLDLEIPPAAGGYESKATMTLAAPARLLSIQPHMHVRGKSMKVDAAYPNGKKETLLDVPRYDFNWQTTYALRDPAELPVGTVLESKAAFDNSANNKYNPDPKSTVHWGDQTTDEMHIAFLELVIDAKANPEALVSSAPKMVGEPTKK